MHQKAADAAKSKEVLKYIDWSFTNGGAMAAELDYVAMPPAVIKLMQAEWKKQIKDSAGKSVW
jgi:phosphate transport system substrate-binding protein